MFAHHLSTIAPVKSSFQRHFHAGDHSQDGKSFFCATAGQGKTTASNGLDSVISPGLVILFFFFYFSIPFDAPTKQDDPREHKWKFDNFLLSFFFFLPFFFQPSCTFAASVPVSLTFTSLSLISVRLNCLSAGERGYLTASFTPTPFHRALTSDLW